MADILHEWLSLKEAARYEGVPYETLKKRYQRGHIILRHDDHHRQKLLAPITALSPKALEARRQEIIDTPQDPSSNHDYPIDDAAVAASPAAIVPVRPDHQMREERSLARMQRELSFAEPTKAEEQRKKALAAIPEWAKPHVDKCLLVVGDCHNGTFRHYLGSYWNGYLIKNRDDYIKAKAKLHDVSYSWIYSHLKTAKAILHDASIPDKQKWIKIAQAYVPQNRPGRSSAAFFVQSENAWMASFLLGRYLDQATRPTMIKAYHELIELIEKKQRTAGLKQLYVKPTFSQVRTLLEKIDRPTKVLGREGEKAFYQKCAPHISRKPPEFSNLIWEADQRNHNIITQDAGHRIGRIWSENNLDVTSELHLGSAYSPVVSSDMVMRAAAESLATYGVPIAIHYDQGEEVKGKRFTGGFFSISNQTLHREAMGLWNRLGVRIVPAIGGNPRTKTIERWHKEVDKFDAGFSRQYWIWRAEHGREIPIPIDRYCVWTGSNTRERPSELLDPIIKQHYDWLAGRAENPCVPTIEEYFRFFMEWCQKWNSEARGTGRYRQGMTPQECFNVKRRPDVRMLTEAEVDYYTADHRQEEVAKGGQINLKCQGHRIEYTAPELFSLQGGDKVEVILSRRTYDSITVIYNVPGGTAFCEAQAKELYDWLPEGDFAEEKLRAANRAVASAKRKVKAGVKAQRLLAEAANPIELLEMVAAQPAKDTKELFGQAPAAPPHAETGSLEWAETHRRRIASTPAIPEPAPLDVSAEPEAISERGPSLYELTDCTAEEL